MAAPLLEALGLSADLAPTLTYVMTGLALLTLMTLVFANVHILSSMMPEVFTDAKTHEKLRKHNKPFVPIHSAPRPTPPDKNHQCV